MDIRLQLITEIKAKADELGISPSTVGERAGQGGQFYSRLERGCRVWPETAEKVLAALKQMNSSGERAS
jgi:DNA-binding LacI/PurR family transcriptional regulator